MNSNVSSLAGPFEGRTEPAALSDVVSLAAMGEALHAASDYRHLDYSRVKVEALLTHLIQDPSGVVFVSRRGGHIVGACAGAVLPNWFGEDLVGVEYSFFVEPGSRNEMRGTALILGFVGWCRLRGARQVRVGISTGVNVQETAKLYRGLGFVDAGFSFSKEL